MSNNLIENDLEQIYIKLLSLANSNSKTPFAYDFKQSKLIHTDKMQSTTDDSTSKNEFVCFVDISELIRTRASTGIQRVVKEFISRAIKHQNFIIILFNYETGGFEKIKNHEVLLFLSDTKNYKFIDTEPFEILTINIDNKIFFDIDSVWNSPLSRAELYPKLKSCDFVIMNFMYDLIPIVMPDVFMSHTVQNFCMCLSAILTNSDCVLFDSNSAESDFIKIKNTVNINRQINTSVVYLGNDFQKYQTQCQIDLYENILNKKFILFVGTIEPRKRHDVVLEAFEVLSKKYDDLHLVFIGKEGWMVREFVDKLTSNPLFAKKIHWLRETNDDILEKFYKKCFLTVYLSDYEGYGLPVAESLKYGNIIIASDNSSIREVGGEFSDYIDNKSSNLIKKIINWIENNQLYLQKKSYIKHNYKQIGWDDFFIIVSGKINKKLSNRNKKIAT